MTVNQSAVAPALACLKSNRLFVNQTRQRVQLKNEDLWRCSWLAARLNASSAEGRNREMTVSQSAVAAALCLLCRRTPYIPRALDSYRLGLDLTRQSFRQRKARVVPTLAFRGLHSQPRKTFSRYCFPLVAVVKLESAPTTLPAALTATTRKW